MTIQHLLVLENNLSFQQLNQQINSFNALKVLKLENYEIRHSNILAWLLDPKENHGLRDIFIRKMLEYLLLNEDNYEHSSTGNVIHLLNHSLMESHVYRELKTDQGRYIDLVIVNQQQKFAIILENKYYSSESQNQLNDYLTFIQKNVEGFTIVPIYLTLDGEKPSDEHYFSLSYEQIEHILSSILGLYQDQLPANQFAFITDYHHLLKEKYYPNQEQIEQAITIYRDFSDLINSLFEQLSNLYKPLHFEAGYLYEFITKYKDTITYIYNHGQNIISYSFEQFMQRQFDNFIRFNNHPSVPSFLPLEWANIEKYAIKNPKYWLGKGLVVWFQKTADQRLRIKAELGPIESQARISLLTKFEKNGLTIKEHSKSENAIYTSVYTKKIDIQKWNDISEITDAMCDLYNDPQFAIVREKIAAALNGQHYVSHHAQPTNELTNIQNDIKRTFETWMKQKQIPSTNYRMSNRNLSFKLPLFDDFKELFGETREKWWWDNGPLLFWVDTRNNSLNFVLEVGPIEADKRVAFLQAIQDKGISFNLKGLNEASKYTRLYSKTISIEHANEAELLKIFDEFYEDENLRIILEKLKEIYIEFNQLTN